MAATKVTKLYGHGREMGTVTATIAQNGTESGQVDLEGFAISGLIIPTITTGNVTFKVSNSDSGTDYVLKDEDGNTITIVATTGNFAVASDFLSCLDAYRYVKIVAATQASAVSFIFCVKG